MVARPYLRTPRSAIVDMTLKVRRKRHEFIRAVSKGLIPPETPPALRRVRRRRFPGLMEMDPVEDVKWTQQVFEQFSFVHEPPGRGTKHEHLNNDNNKYLLTD